jgi:phosphoribosyl 1,2-cyclic phosphate phosphodiesterase
MKIRYLGTAAAERIPAMFCNCQVCRRAMEKGGKNVQTQSQALIDEKLLVDFSGDTWHHFMAMGRTLWDIEHVLITHSHVDHFTFESFALRVASNAKGVAAEKMKIYTSRGVIDRLWECLRVRGNKKLEKIPERIEFIPMDYYRPFTLDGITVTPLPAEHAGDEQAFLFLLESGGKTLFYGNDTGFFGEEIDDYLVSQGKHIDLLSLDCTKGDNPFPYKTHMSMEEGSRIAARFAAKGLIDEHTKRYFTHFSHNNGMIRDELAEVAKAKYGFEVTYDGCEVEV